MHRFIKVSNLHRLQNASEYFCSIEFPLYDILLNVKSLYDVAHIVYEMNYEPY